jgi:hypothetical protein
MRWNMDLRQEFVNEFFEQQYERNVSQLPLDMERPRRPIDFARFLQFIFQFHNDHVREFVRKHPSHAFLEVDISHNETGQLLADKFGLDASCWGHHNEAKKHRGKKGFPNVDGFGRQRQKFLAEKFGDGSDAKVMRHEQIGRRQKYMAGQFPDELASQPFLQRKKGRQPQKSIGQKFNKRFRNREFPKSDKGWSLNLGRDQSLLEYEKKRMPARKNSRETN